MIPGACEIPMPPSLNARHRMVRNRPYATKEYKDWLKLAGPVMAEHWPRFTTVVSLHIDVFGGKHFPESGDLDNLFKAVLDGLQAKEYEGKPLGAGILENDSVRFVKRESSEYFTREEHWEMVHPGTTPRKKDLDALLSRCFVTIEPYKRLGGV